MKASFYRLFLLVVLVVTTALAASSTAQASPFNRLMPTVRAKMKGQQIVHRPIYRAYKPYRHR
ncbi:hypothetical protein [Hymenobacter sp. AT01-02]|uniref:hypothetical protein n=1 Tax=Hymenobacter sp. AT01-02 TaxID=1571877 RepID=UPI0005F0CB76|nr:hypothetical protein [Hymenobacter sp. AT01-02]